MRAGRDPSALPLYLYLPVPTWKKGHMSASRAVARLCGSIVRSDRSNLPRPDGRSCSEISSSIGLISRTCSMLRDDSTPPILCHPRESKHSSASELVDLSRRSLRNGPTARSIRARCSALSCVANRSSPSYSSEMMQPADHRSEGKLQPQPRITSGARYCLVLTVVLFFSLSYVAPPKSITFTLVLAGTRRVAPSHERYVVSSFVDSRMFSGFRSVWIRPKPRRKSSASSSCLAKSRTQYIGNGW
mmetsp:Transcript_31185/g.74355  ORF Transcript_31185/g.74355 Transcript_31185/m.74355 type:complete len:245 (+) Transcript_31185:31-765(+)